MNNDLSSFNFENYRIENIEKYKKVFSIYDSFTSTLYELIKKFLGNRNLKYYSIEHRTKDYKSFGKKSSIPSDENPNSPKYDDPLKQITDISGIRVITYFLDTISDIEEVIENEFNVIEKIDKRINLIDENKFGYQSIHYIVKLNENRIGLSEYAKFKSLNAEIQIRTILQHAWAEIEHDIQYKSVYTIPVNIKRRFMALAGLLEIADREFQTIHDVDEKYNNEDMIKIKKCDYENVRITPKSLKIYLDKKIGSDARMNDFSYDFETRILLKLGFKNIKEIDDCIKIYGDDLLSRIIWTSRHGQLNRFELMLLAGMGEHYIKNHILYNTEWFPKIQNINLETLKDNEITIGNYNPIEIDQV